MDRIAAMVVRRGRTWRLHPTPSLSPTHTLTSKPCPWLTILILPITVHPCLSNPTQPFPNHSPPATQAQGAPDPRPPHPTPWPRPRRHPHPRRRRKRGRGSRRGDAGVAGFDGRADAGGGGPAPDGAGDTPDRGLFGIRGAVEGHGGRRESEVDAVRAGDRSGDLPSVRDGERKPGEGGRYYGGGG